MSKYLITTSETYRVNSEALAIKLIEEAKADNRFMVTKSAIVYKHIKETKNTPEDEYWLCTLTKQFTDAKEPECTVSVDYTVDDGVFPDPVESEEE